MHRSTTNNLSILNLCLAQPSFPSVNFCHSSRFRLSCSHQTIIEFPHLHLGNTTLVLSILVNPLIRHFSICGVFPSLLLVLACLFDKLYSWNILAPPYNSGLILAGFYEHVPALVACFMPTYPRPWRRPIWEASHVAMRSEQDIVCFKCENTPEIVDLHLAR